MLYRPTLTGASFVNVDATYSGVEYDITASAVSGGIIIYSDYLATGEKNRTQKTGGLLDRVLLTLRRTGVSDIITIAAIRTTSTNSDVFSSIQWKEIR